MNSSELKIIMDFYGTGVAGTSKIISEGKEVVESVEQRVSLSKAADRAVTNGLARVVETALRNGRF